MLSSTTVSPGPDHIEKSVEGGAIKGYLEGVSGFHDFEALEADKQTLYQLKALQVGACIQTSLKPEIVVRRFSRGVAEIVSHSGLSFEAADDAFEVTLGRRAKHSCAFSLLLEQHPLGHLTLTRGRPFLEQEVEGLEYLATALVYPLSNALQHRFALQASMTDALTGIYNRSIVEDTLRRETRLARRFKNPFSLVLFDVDGFKEVNDRYGHETGDEALKAVVKCVSQSLRETDVFARYGGDEFVILLNNTGKKGAKVLAQHILERTHQRDCLDFGEIPVTLSIGVATLKAGETEKAFLKRADKAMYRAKGKGGDQIQVAGGKVVAKPAT